MAALGMKGFGWFVCGIIVAPACYLVSSRVAEERGRVEAVDLAIIQAHQDIRTLETEFGTRANLAQLERWNGDVLALTAPQPAQYLADDLALASFGAQGGPPLPTVFVMPSGAYSAPVIAPAAPVAVDRAAPIQTAQLAEHAAVREEVQTVALRAKGQAMAMLDQKLLSDSTLGDLMKGARSEAMSLR